MDAIKTFGLNETQQSSTLEKAQRAQTVLKLYETGQEDVSDKLNFSEAEISYIASTNPELAQEIEKLKLIQKEQAQEAEKNTTKLDYDVNNLNDLNKMLDKLDAEIALGKTELETKKKELVAAKENLEREQKVYDEFKKQYNKKRDDLKETNESIAKANKDLAQNLKEQQQRATSEAKSSYNEEEDGPWEAYLQKKLAGVTPDASIEGLINSLTSKSNSLSTQLTTLKTKVSTQQSIVSRAQQTYKTASDNFDSYSKNLTNKINERDTLATKISNVVKSNVSDAEKTVLEKNSVNLTDRLANGMPKYILAKDKEDDSYHVYEMSEEGTSAQSITAKYGIDETPVVEDEVVEKDVDDKPFELLA